MFVRDLTDDDYTTIRKYDGTKTLREIFEIFKLENSTTKTGSNCGLTTFNLRLHT